MAKRSYKQIRGFVMNRKSGHTSYAFRQSSKNVQSLGFTHNKDDKADKQKLKHNIDPNDTSDCYVKTKIEHQKYNDYRYAQKYKNYRIHPDDKAKVYYIIGSRKQKKR